MLRYDIYLGIGFDKDGSPLTRGAVEDATSTLLRSISDLVGGCTIHYAYGHSPECPGGEPTAVVTTYAPSDKEDAIRTLARAAGDALNQGSVLLATSYQQVDFL